ncbi:hypothetical protein L917_18111 [Phytophthora nicotianae]|uniref:Uncharacterized protein n=1 Tax=Phytophthora nicotianae TaxID=4792 RepID=W2KB25_PHYNI|nr:hypothetical protein L917_18111 [Phytophthora nicotianae]
MARDDNREVSDGSVQDVASAEEAANFSELGNSQTVVAAKPRSKNRSGKKKSVFWDKDAVIEGKTSIRLVLNWLTTQGNYDKWRGSDRTNGKTKEALLKEIVADLHKAKLLHRDTAGVREKINQLETGFRKVEDFLACTGQGITNETSLRAEILRRCAYYYELKDVMTDRPSARPEMTSDEIKERGIIATTKMDPVEELLLQQTKTFASRESQRERAFENKARKQALKERELALKEAKNLREQAQADVDLALKKIQLEKTKRESVVQLLLARKKLQE